MTKQFLSKRFGPKRSNSAFLIFRAAAVALVVGTFTIFGFSVKNSLALSWAEPSVAPPDMTGINGPVWAQNAGVQTGGLWVNGKGRFDTASTADANCTAAKVCGADNGAGFGLSGESATGIGLYAASGSAASYAGDFNGNVYVYPGFRLGLGVAPSYTLDVLANIANGAIANFESSSTSATNTGITLRNSSTVAAARDWGLLTNSVTAGDFVVKQSNALGGDPVAAGAVRLYIDPSGKVGIANTAPSALLTLGTAGTTAGSLYLAGGTANGITVNVPASVTTAYAITLPPAAPTVNGQVLSATTAGVASWTTVGGGSQTPWTANVNAAGFTLQGNSTASGNLTLDSTSNATKGYVLLNPTSGNVGINTATPGSALDVKGAVRHSGATSGYMAVAVPATVTSYTLTFPAAVGASGQVLQTTNATGTLGWVTPAAGGGTVTSTGSANYVPLFTTATNIGNSVIQQSGSSIGIGVNPSYTLQVAGSLYASGQMYSNGVTVCQSNGTNCPSSGSQWTTNGSVIYYNGGNVGINTTTATNGKLDVENTTGGAGGTGVYGSCSGGSCYGVNGLGSLAGVYGSGAGYGVWGNTTAGNAGVYGTASGATTYGVQGNNASNIGVYGTGNTGVSGYAASGVGVAGQGSVAGVRGTGIGNAPGVSGVAPGSGYAVSGVNSANGIGVYGNGGGGGVWGTTNNSGAYGVYGENLGGGYGLYTPSSAYVGSALSVGSSLTVSGNITGYGSIASNLTITSGPATKAFYASYGSGAAGASLLSNWNTSDYWGIGSNNGGNDRVVRIGSAAYDGTWNSNYITLEIPGSILATQGFNLQGVGTADVSAARVFDAGNDLYLQFGSGGYTYFRAQNGAYVANITAGGYAYMSDVRLKQRITGLTDDEGLSAIEQLNPVSFYWKDPIRGTEKQVGFIAQDVQKIFPQLITHTPDGMLSLNYQGLISPIVKSIQEQQKEITDQKTQQDAVNQALEAKDTKQQQEIESLRQQIEALKAK